MNPRRTLNNWSLLYLFSYDFELAYEREVIGETNGGVRLNLFAQSGLTRVYNVARNAVVAGSDSSSITGQMSWGGDQLLLRDDDTAVANIRLSIATDDGATVHMSYASVVYLGPGGTRRIVSAKHRDRVGTEDAPVTASLVISPRFETADPRYQWLNEYQGIGFGQVQIINSRFRRTTIDTYVLT